MILNSRRTHGCATSQTTLLAVALLTFLGAGALWSVSAKMSGKAPKSKSPEMTAAARTTETRTAGSTFAAPATVSARSLLSTAKLPLAFEPNRGQTDPRASYVAHGSGYGLFLTPTEAIVALSGALSAKGGNSSTASIHMQLEGSAATANIAASEPLPGKSNYFRGNDPSRWVRNVPTFARVQYSAVYPGIDLVYYGKQGQLEYDFAVRSGADPNQIRFRLSGAQKVSLGADGSLRLKTPVREVRWNKPVIYQEINGQRRNVAGSFKLLADNRVGFSLGRYDRSRDLIIDPVLAYATYFGGSGNEINPQVATDVNSNLYLAGTTTSGTAFPIPVCTLTTCPAAPVVNGASDVFVSKLDPVGSTVLYTTFLNGTTGASLADSSAGLTVDNAGNAYVTGTTTSIDFPVTLSTASQTAPVAAGAHVFLSKLDSTGATLAYSSYLSGSNADNALAVAANNLGQAYILGWTQSVTDGDFLQNVAVSSSAFQQHANGATRLYFIAKFDTTLSGAGSLKAFSFLGDANPAAEADGVVCAQLPCGGIALDSTGNAYVAFGTTFTNLPATNAFQATNHGLEDVYLAKASSDLTGILSSTYVGGSGDDVANALALDSGGNVYITGSTTSSDFPATATKGLPAGGGQDAFVVRLGIPTSGVITLTYSSYLGGSGTDTGFAIVADVSQNAYVAGSTDSSNFPVPNAGTPLPAAKGLDAFLAKLDTSKPPLTTLVSSVLLGGSGTDRATSMAENSNGAILVAGETSSVDFPAQSLVPGFSVLQPALSGSSDAFLANFGPQTDLSLTVTASPKPVAAGNVATFTYSVRNNGPDTSTGAVVTISVPPSTQGATVGTFTSTSGSCAATGTTGNQVETCTLGTIAANSSATITVGLTPTIVPPPNGTNNVPNTVQMSGHVVAGNSAVDNVHTNDQGADSTNVDYFTTAVAPASVSVAAGKTAKYTVTLTPHTPPGVTPVQFPANIALRCTQPTTPVVLAGATCTFTPTTISTIPSTSGSATSVMTITTTAPTATASMHSTPTFWYALWLPLCGVAFLGAGTSRRRWVSGAALVVLLGTVSLLPACGKKATATTTTGTQPGVYAITVAATSGTFTNPPTTSPLNVSLIVTAP